MRPPPQAARLRAAHQMWDWAARGGGGGEVHGGDRRTPAPRRHQRPSGGGRQAGARSRRAAPCAAAPRGTPGRPGAPPPSRGPASRGAAPRRQGPRPSAPAAGRAPRPPHLSPSTAVRSTRGGSPVNRPGPPPLGRRGPGGVAGGEGFSGLRSGPRAGGRPVGQPRRSRVRAWPASSRSGRRGSAKPMPGGRRRSRSATRCAGRVPIAPSVRRRAGHRPTRRSGHAGRWAPGHAGSSTRQPPQQRAPQRGGRP